MKTLRRKSGAILVILLLVTGTTNGQQATEVYIPIGESPGVSGHETLHGVIRAIDYATRSIEIQVGDSVRTVTMNDKTWYFLDRTGKRRSNSTGTLHDCETGRTVEVKVSESDLVEWIKIEIR